MANVFKKAMQRHNIKKEDSVHSILDKIKQGKYDVTDEKIISYCIDKINNFYDVINIVDNLKIDFDKYLNTSNVIDVIATKYADCLNKGDFFGIDYYNHIFSKIKEKNNFEELIGSKLNIDSKLIDQSIVENGIKYLDEYVFKMIKNHGYLPFRTIDDFSFIFKSSQQDLYELGLIDEYVYEKMIMYKLNQYLNWINSNEQNVEKPNYPLISVDFEIKNETARYWIEQSKKLGIDSIEFIMEYVKSSKNDLEYRFKIFGNDNNSLFNNFIPQTSFFNSIYRGFPIINCFPVEYQKLQMIDFLANNPNQYNELYKKYFELYKKLDDEESKHYYTVLFSGSMNFSNENLVFDNRKLNEKGITEEAYKSALNSFNCLKVIFKLDNNWIEHYSKKELHYIEILNKKPNFIKDLREYGVFNRQISSTSPVTQFIDLYFDEQGLKKEFFIDSKLYFLENPLRLKNLDELEIEWEQYYTKKELHYIKYSVEYSDLKNYNIANNIDKYFDDNGIRPELVNWCFNNKKWECLLNITGDLNNKSATSQLNDIEYKILLLYKDIDNIKLRVAFQTYVIENINNIDTEKIDLIKIILQRIMYSNSSEMKNYGDSLIYQLLNSNKPLENLDKIEKMFLKNNIPFVGKAFSTFEILHPNFMGVNFEKSTISPVLKKSSNRVRRIVCFSDLIKASFGSNNRSVNKYLNNIEVAGLLYEEIKKGKIEYDKLKQNDKKELEIFFNHLVTLYDNTNIGNVSERTIEFSNDVISNITKLKLLLSPNGSLDYNLQDRIVSMFCHFAGFDSIEKTKKYIYDKINNADSRNRSAAKSNMQLVRGDLIKGIGDIKYLRNILQNGSVSKEYLNANIDSDLTPLDTDLSMLLEGSISDTAANSYGPIWLVLKNDDRFITTRTDIETLDVKNDMSKLELFYTGVMGKGHYGIRTGFASTEINYIVMEKFDPRVGLEIAMNGFYIPVADKSGKIIFTPQDYDKLREKMSGMEYYENKFYKFSDNLVTDETSFYAEQIEKNNYEIRRKRTKINEIIAKSIEELGLNLKTIIDGDLTEGFVELIDTGSTGRGTNKPGDGDFDFMMRLDNFILCNPSRLNELKQTILKNLGKENSSEVIGTGDFRLKNVQIDSEINVDIDITFVPKTDKLNYSTDMALCDRLTTIQRIDSEKYKYVIANILLAKKVLKQAQVYKPNRGETPQGGLGGVGIENWILQNGGSFIDAAKSFLDAAAEKDFESFKQNYCIWDFGDNHLAIKKGEYPNDNFVSCNMSEAGYNKMKQVLTEYLKQYYKDEIANLGK